MLYGFFISFIAVVHGNVAPIPPGPILPVAKAFIKASAAAGATGEVVVYEGFIQIELDLTDFDFSQTQTTRQECRYGVSYSVHSEIPGTLVGDACGAAGGHYDPWYACGPSTGSSECLVNGGCVDRHRPYHCTPAGFRADPLTMCEVGDWSGKYGLLRRVNRLQDKYVIDTSLAFYPSSRFEIGASQLYRTEKSIVFQCGNHHVLCAKFLPDPFMLRPDFAVGKGLQMATMMDERLVADFGALSGPLVEFGGGQVKIGGIRGSTDMKKILQICGGRRFPPVFSILDEPMPYDYIAAKGYDCPVETAHLHDPTISCSRASESLFCWSELGPQGLFRSERCGGEPFYWSAQDFDSDPYLMTQGLLKPYHNSVFNKRVSYRLLDTSPRALEGRTLLIWCKNPLVGPKWCAKIMPGPADYEPQEPNPEDPNHVSAQDDDGGN